MYTETIPLLGLNIVLVLQNIFWVTKAMSQLVNFQYLHPDFINTLNISFISIYNITFCNQLQAFLNIFKSL